VQLNYQHAIYKKIELYNFKIAFDYTLVTDDFLIECVVI
jgi:hypothetical protein